MHAFTLHHVFILNKETVEMYKTKTESLEEQVGDMKKLNNALIDRLETTQPDSKTPPINRGYSDGTPNSPNYIP